MNIRVIENKKDFLNLKNDWDRLSQDLITVNKFEWLYKWWNNFENGKNLKALEFSIYKGSIPIILKKEMILKSL